MTSEFEAAPLMIQPTLLSRRQVLGGVALAIAVATLPRMAWAQTPSDQASAFIDKTSQELASAVNGSATTSDKAAALQAIIDRSVDVSSVGRFCLGRFWRLATPAEQAEYIELFHRVLVQNITGKVGDYQGVSITVVRTAQREDGVAVTTTVTRPNSAPNRVDWLVSAESGAIKIVDVIAEGTSLRLTQRNDYAAYLSRNNNSVPALITALRQQLNSGT
jgi:phospholipid transport system substrate-binding protein